MYITDFEYAGKRLSEYGCIVCYFDSNDENISLCSELTWNTIKNNNSSISKIISTQYNDVYTTTFQITKNPCLNNGTYKNNFMDIELREMMKWLNRKTYHKFKAIYDDGSFDDVCYYGSFNVSAIKVGSNIVGLELTFQTNAPYGFGNEVEYNIDVDENNNNIVIYNTSDEEGNLYLNVTITCKADGDIKIVNQNNHGTTVIKNCISGEVITLDGENRIITSSKEHPTLYNDFNYYFPRLIAEYDQENSNTFTVTPNCNMVLSYSPIRKAGIV